MVTFVYRWEKDGKGEGGIPRALHLEDGAGMSTTWKSLSAADLFGTWIKTITDDLPRNKLVIFLHSYDVYRRVYIQEGLFDVCSNK